MSIKKERKLNRWQGFDYSFPGYYFVTICTKGRQSWFGEVADNEMKLNEMGKIVEQCWLDLPNHYINCRLDYFVIMPNHFHGIIEIFENENYFAPTDVGNGLKPFPTTHGLSEIVRALKTFSSRGINKIQNNFHFSWQKSFHDRVIRDENELSIKREYIFCNPGKWAEDRNNPLNNDK